MKRVFWLGVGLAIGALVVRAVSKKAQAYTPRGLAAAARDSGGNLLDSVRDFLDDVRDGIYEREQELHAAFAEGVLLADEAEEFGEAGEFDDDFGEGDFGEVFGEPNGSTGPADAGQRPSRTPPEGNTR